MLLEMRNTPNPTHAQELVALRTGRDPAQLLWEMYVQRGIAQGAIAKELGVSRQTVAFWLREAGITRDMRGDAA